MKISKLKKEDKQRYVLIRLDIVPLTYPTAFYEVEVTKIELRQSLDAILCKVNLCSLL